MTHSEGEVEMIRHIRAATGWDRATTIAVSILWCLCWCLVGMVVAFVAGAPGG